MTGNNNRVLWFGLGLVALALVLGPLLRGGMWMMGGPGMMGWYGAPGANGWLWGLGMGIGGLVMVAFWAAVIGLVVFAVRRIGGADGGNSQHAESPKSILDRRYAAGEITREQYEEMRRVLEAGAA